jgi:hypothetical protein
VSVGGRVEGEAEYRAVATLVVEGDRVLLREDRHSEHGENGSENGSQHLDE